MKDAGDLQNTSTTASEVIASNASDLRTAYCKLLGVAHLFLQQGESDCPPKDSSDGSYGLGLLLEQIGQELKEISGDLEALVSSLVHDRSK